jgi:hypothetical protein
VADEIRKTEKQKNRDIDRPERRNPDGANENLTTADLADAGDPSREHRELGPGLEMPPSELEARGTVQGKGTTTSGRDVVSGSHAGTAAVRQRTSQAEGASPLFAPDEAIAFRARWDDIQVSFVDEPRRCVEQADSLIAETMKRLAEVFAAEREGLERQWDRGDQVSTEDLRLTLRRYRSFFSRLLSV